ncbi:MAG: DUF3082 domain-containing protein [Microcoleus sp.]
MTEIAEIVEVLRVVITNYQLPITNHQFFNLKSKIDMTDLSNSEENSQSISPAADSLSVKPQPTVLRCFMGSLIASVFACGLYSLTMSIALSFASKPVHSDNITVIKIGVAVRTLVVGMVALGTGVFGIAALGLLLLGLQIGLQKLLKKTAV